MIDLVPLKLFSERHKEGWRLLPGYELKAGDFAATMVSPDHVFLTKSNLERGAESGKRGWKYSTKPRTIKHVEGRS
jgi:hypothetical protein